MPIFENNGRKYNVKDEHINNFLAEFPNSSTIMERNGKKYRVKSADYKAFLEEFDDPIQEGIDAGEITLTMPEPNKPAELPQEANLVNEERKIPGFFQGETDVDTFVQEVEQQRKANEEREARNKAWEEKRKQLYRQGSIADYNQYLEDEIKRVDQEGNLEDKRRMAKILRNESADAYRSYIQANPEIANDPSFMESIGRGLKSTVAGTAGSLIDAAASMMGDNYLEEGTGKVLPTNKEDLIRNNLLTEYAAKESVDAQPKSAEGGNKGVIDLLREGKVGDALQSAVASGTESAAQSALAFVPVVGTPLVFASNYGRNYAENLDQDMSESQRVVSALGSAGIEAVIERVGGNPVKWFKSGKNITDETTKNIIKNIIHEAEKSPQQAVKEAAKILGNAFAEEGGEELATGPLTDAWNTVVDGVFGNGANGIIAQYEAMKDQNPNLTVGQFLAEKGKEYAEAGLVGGIAGMGMGGTVAGAGAAVGSIQSRAEFKQQQDKAYEEALEHNPALSRKQWDKQQEELGRGNYKAFQRHQREYAQEQLAGLDQVANERGISREEAYEQVVQANRKQKQGETLSEEETNLLNQFEQGANNKWQEHHLEHISNKEDGNIIYAQTPQQEDVNIVKGHVEYRTDSEGNTTFDEENSDAYVYVRYNNTGAVKQVPLAELQYTTHQSVEDTKRDLARLQQFTPGTTVYMVDGNGAIMMAPNGEPATTTIKGVTQDGIVITIGENEVETVIPREEALKQFRTEEEIASIIPQETSTGVAQEGEVEVDNVGEQPSPTPTPTPITQEQPQPSVTLQSGIYVNPKGEEVEIEVLENGNVNMRNGEQVVENMHAETAQNLITNAGFTAKGQPEVPQPVISQLEQDIADAEEFIAQGDNDYVADNITQAQKRVEQASKRKPKSTDKAQRLAELQSINQEKAQAQAELDRWMKVQEEMDKRRIQSTLANERSNTPQGEQEANVAQENVSQQWNNAPKIEGRKDVRTLPNGTQISGRYVLVGDGAATPSHNPLNGWATSEGFPVNERGQNVNDRDYRNDKNAQMETERIASNYGGQAVENVPTVSAEGVVYDGNGRVMAGMIAAQNGTDQAYTDALKQKAEMFGFTEEQVDSIPHARVLFVTDEVLPYTTETFAQFNQNEKKTQGSTETAVSKSKSLNDETRSSVLSIMDRYDSLQGFFNSSDGGIDVLKTLQDNGVIGFADMAALTEEIDGKVVLSAQGRDFVTNVLIGSLFSERVIRMMGNDRGLKQSILRALPAIVENRKLGDYALTQDIENAIQLLYEARNANMPFILYLRQGNAFDGYVHERFSAFAMLLAEEMSAGVEEFRQVLTLYNTSAINEANGQTSMFGVRSPEDIKNKILDRYGKQSSERQSKQSRPSNQETESAVQGTQPSDEEEVSGNRRLSKEGDVVDAESEEASQRIEDNSEPTSTEEPIAKKLAQEADTFVKAMGGKGVHIVNDVEELPGSEGMAYRAIKSGEKVMGWYNLDNNQVYIYTPNANDEQEVFETLLHEFVAHKGLRDLMGHRKFDNMCKNVWSMMDSNRRLQFALYVKESLAIGSTGMLERINAMSEQEKKSYLDALSDNDCLAAADEFIAHFAEYGVSEEERTIWQKIVDTIRQWLRDVGFIVGISEREIAQLLNESHNRLTRDMTIGEMAEAVMRSKNIHARLIKEGDAMGFDREGIIYKSKDGKTIRYKQLSLFNGTTITDNDGSGANNVRRSRTTTLSTLNHLRELEDGEICYVERQFTESGEFDFMTGNKIESCEDVAYIFKNLENEAIENTFGVLIKNGKPTILHLGMGNHSASVIDFSSLIVAVNRIDPDRVVFVHNHPSGKLICSPQDKQAYSNLEKAIGEKMEDGIIINTRSGEFVTFNQYGLTYSNVIPTNKEGKKAKVYKFNKQSFKVDAPAKFEFSSYGIAEFISTQRLGARDKLNVLLMNHAGECVGNVFLTDNQITASNAGHVAQQIVHDALSMGGYNVVLYGRSESLNVSAQGTNIVNNLSDIIQRASSNMVRLVDVIEILNDGYESANDNNIRFRFTEEEQGIIDKSKADGTWMKAPNGEPTNLNEKQWAQVRTKAFKKWFGDWEKAARIDKLRESKPVEMNGEEHIGKYELNRESAQSYILNNLRGNYVIADTNEQVELVKKGAKKVTSHSMGNDVHVKSIALIPKIIQSSIFVEEMPSEKDDSQYDSYRYYVCGLDYNGESYTVKVTIGVKGGDYYYDHSLTEVEKGKLLDMIESNQAVNRKGFTPTGDAPIPSYALSRVKDTKLLSILQTNSSKIVDENGEPMEVWHGGKFGISIFTPNRNMHFGTRKAAMQRILDEEFGYGDWLVRNEDGTFSWKYENEYDESYNLHSDKLFATAEEAMEDALSHLENEYAVKPYFLNIRNIKRTDDVSNSWDEEIDIAREENAKIDGIVYENVYEDAGSDSYIAFDPNQIKSAETVTYDDNGNVIPLSERFNDDKSDIRFSIAKVTTKEQRRIDAEYLEAARNGDIEKATDLFREFVYDKAVNNKVIPMDYVFSYKKGLSIAKGLKRGNKGAIEEAAYRMAVRIPKNSIIVPMPSRVGYATYTKELAEQIARYTDSEVMDVLKGTERPSMYEMKLAGVKLSNIDLGFRVEGELPKGKNIVIVDNVIDRGMTAYEAVKAIKGASVFAYAYTNQDKDRVLPLKLTDPITYDDKYRIIPLSQRYNEKIDDLRFSIANENQRIFVSNAERAVESIKQEKATPQQWKAMIEKQGGLKAGEDKWLGLSDWLNEKANATIEMTNDETIAEYAKRVARAKTLTKQEILDFIDENKIQIEEVKYTQFGYGLIDEATRKLEAELKEIGWDAMVEKYPGFDELFEVYNGELLWSEERASVGEYEDFIIDEKIVDLDSQDNAINETREKYTTDGLERKREIALVVPTIESWNKNDEIHFGDAGGGRAVAWVRFGETTDSEGNRVLVIDEIQSKRHQEGREKGYKREFTKEEEAEYKDLTEEYQRISVPLKMKYGNYIIGRFRTRPFSDFSEEEIKQLVRAENILSRLYELESVKIEGIPSAPFDKNWHELAMKRMLRYAAENGYDYVAWTTGEQQADRYDIGKVVNRIESNDTVDYDSTLGVDLVKQVVLFTHDGNAITLRLTPEGIVRASSQYNGHHISDIVGKELGNRIMTETDLVLKEQDLRIGGEGMKGFYDKMLPSFVSKYTKKWGAKVEDIELPKLEKSAQTMHAVNVTPEMKKSVMEGQVMFSIKDNKKAPETVSVQDEHLQTVVSSADGAKVLKDLDNAIVEYENDTKTKEKTFLGNLAKVLGAKQDGSNSQYATFEAMNGKVFTIRLSNHNAKVSTFDNHDESEGISIVITPQKNNGITNDGDAHVTEYYYDAIKLRRADSKPLVEILKSVKQSLYSGEYKDTTGLAEIQEVNDIRFRTTYHGSASYFAKFDHSFMGTGEGLQSFGWGTYVTEVEDVAKRYANVALKGEQKFKYIGDKDVKKSIVEDAEGLIDNAGGFDEALQMYEGHRLPPHYPLAIAFDFIRSTSKSDWEGQRHMYEVEIPDANEAYYIDYKERMSNQGEIFTMVDNALASDGWQRKEVDDKVVFSDGVNRIVLNPKQTGGDFYNELAFGFGSPQAASEYLNDVVGITGIQYDVNYHNGGNEDGHKNYVIFNADDAQVVSNTRFSIRGNAWSDVPAYNPGETIGEYIQRVNAWKQERNVMAQKEYEEFLNQQGTRMNRNKQKWIDRYSPIEDLLNMLTAKGVKIDPYDNAYTYMMLSGGKAQWDTQEFQKNQVKRMADAFNAIINSNSLDDLAESMTWRNMPDKQVQLKWWNPKSWSRRYRTEMNNRPLSVRELIGVYLQAKDVEEAKAMGLVNRGEEGFVNNLGMTYQDVIDVVEERLNEDQREELFASVKAANQFALDYLYEHGMMAQEDYEEYSRRKHYVPQRGWRERDMENREMDYVSEQNIGSGSPYNSAVIQAKGRGSLASDPIGYIVSIGNSAIMSAQKNEAKKYFLDLMMENEELFRESGIGVFKKYWVKQEVDTDGNVSYVATYVPPTKGEILKDNATKERIKALQADMYGLRDDLDRQKAILSNLINRKSNMTMDGAIAIMDKGIDAVNAKINRIKNEMSNIEQEIELRKKQIVFVSGVSEDMVQRTAQEKRQHVVYVMKDGQKYELLLENNERLANALNRNFPTPRVGGVIDRVGRGTRYVSGALTQYNPEFAMSNFLRDVQSAMVSNEANFGKEFTGRFAKNLTVVPPILCSYMAKRNQGENDLFGNDELSGYLKEFFEEGAPTGYTYLNDVNELAGLFDEMLQTGKTSKKMLETAKNAGSFLSELSELTTRFAQFVTARQSGYTPRQSAIIAKEVSTNFDRKGTMSSNMGIYAFFNASVQGTYKFFHDKKYLDKNWQKASAAKLMAVSGIMFIAGMLATLLNPDDPEDETMHSEYTRKTNYVIGRVKIPVAHFFRIFYGAGTELALAMQGNKTYANALFDTMDFTMQEVMPIGSLPLSYNREQSKAEVDASKFLLSLVPTYGASTMEALVNQDFRGASIYTPYYTTQDAEHMKRIHQSRKGTPLVYDAIAKGLHWLSGGNPEYEVKEPGMRGIIDVPGSTIQHIVHPFIPGAVIMLGDGISAGISAAKGEKVDAGDVPIARRVVTHDYDLVKDFNGEYWELKGKMEHFEKMYKDGQRFSEEEMQLARRVLGVMEDYDTFYKRYKKQRKSGYDGNFGEYLHEAVNYNAKNLQVLHNLNKEWNRTMY